MPGHYGDKKKKKRKATPFDGVATHGMTNAFKKLTGPKSIKPKAPKAPKFEQVPVPKPQRNRRTGEDFLDWAAQKEKKKKKK